MGVDVHDRAAMLRLVADVSDDFPLAQIVMRQGAEEIDALKQQLGEHMAKGRRPTSKRTGKPTKVSRRPVPKVKPSSRKRPIRDTAVEPVEIDLE